MKQRFSVLVALATILACASSADAGLMVTITAFGGAGLPDVVVINDGDPDDSNGSLGAISYSNADLGGFQIFTVTATRASDPYSATLHTVTIDARLTDGNHTSLQITVVEDDFNTPVGLAYLTSELASVSLPNAGATVTFVSTLDSISTDPLYAVGTTSVLVNQPNVSYELTSDLTFANVSEGTSFSADFRTRVSLPEPASLAVWGLFGLAGAGGAWRRRRKAALAA